MEGAMNQASIRDLFLRYQAQTSPEPLALHIESAQGVYLKTSEGKTLIDFISGIGVSSVGHTNPKVLAAIHEQSEKYLHLMVYGELVQTPSALLAQALSETLPSSLNCVYFVNSGAEATEGAMKLAKRLTGRFEFVSFKGCYHGSTQGALSLMASPDLQDAFRPLLPGIHHGAFNQFDPALITSQTAAVFVEPIQSESGYVPAEKAFMQALRKRCIETGALLVVDEIQSGMGRTGSWWAFQEYGITPDILLTAKALGAGLPLGAFITSHEKMAALSNNPALGHITTFGGNALCCAAGLAGLHCLKEENWMQEIPAKSAFIRAQLTHPAVKEISGKGLMLALDLGSWENNRQVIQYGLHNGVLTDWFLHAPHKLRIAPPLSIPMEELEKACNVIRAGMNSLVG